MSTNYFDGIISASFKTIFTDAIDSLLSNTACTVPCQIIDGDTKFTDCPNCQYSPTTGRSSNKYTVGGPIPFSFGVCPYCKGAGRIPTESTLTIYLALIWNYHDWINWTGIDARILSEQGMVQSISKLKDTYTKIKNAKSILLNTDIDKYKHHRFERYGEPNPIGLGSDRYVLTMWKAAG